VRITNIQIGEIILNSVYNILEECASDNGKLFKINVLEENLDNRVLEQVILATLDPYTQYHIKKIPAYIKDSSPSITLQYALDELKKLSSRELTGHAGRDHLLDLLRQLSEDDGEVIKRVIGKNLKCGVNVGTVNKVYGKNFIPKYPCMLASAYKSENFKHINFPAYVQTKMDGMRANIISENGKVSVRSRNGKYIELHGLFDDYIEDGVIDGELIVLDKDYNILDRKTGNGILNKAVQGTITKEDAAQVRMVAWDTIDLSDFKEGRSDIIYHERLTTLKSKILNDKISVVEEFIAIDMDEVEQLFKEALDRDEEGVIVKNGDAPWEDKRSKFQVKMKVEDDMDLIVTEWNEGEGKYKDLMGSITCTNKDGSIEVHVGSGFTDEDRKMVASDIVGKIVTVKYNEIIQDKNKSTKSLFLPIFVELRLDKTEAD